MRAVGVVLRLAVLSAGLPPAAVGYLPVEIPDIWAWWSRAITTESALTLEGHANLVTSVAILSEASVIVTGSDDETGVASLIPEYPGRMG